MTDERSMPARYGRRDNGLSANAFDVLAEVDPRIGEQLLDVLGSAHVAAYLQPSLDSDMIARDFGASPIPLDSLWVDSMRRDSAVDIVGEWSESHDLTVWPERQVLGSKRPAVICLPSSTDADDEAWEQLIASYESPSETPGQKWPTAEDMPVGQQDRAAASDREPAVALPGDTSTQDDMDDHYVPPPPPPLPTVPVAAIGAVILLASGLVLLIRGGILGMHSRLAFITGALCIVGALVMFFSQLRQDDSDDDPDNGAVV